MVFDLDLARLRARQSAKWRAFGDEVLPAWVAEMDVELAAPIANALNDAIARSDTGYMHIGELPTVTAQFAQSSWGWQFDSAQLVVVPDVVTGIAIVIEAFTQPGDGAVINTPVYPPFFTTVQRVAGRTVIDVPMARDDSGRYSLDLDAIDAAFARPDVTSFILCSPHNPTGTVPTRTELEAIAESASRHGVLVISDEIHAPLTMPGVTHIPYLDVAPEGALAACVMSASKAWNTAGLKCAQVVMNTAEQAESLVAATPTETLYGTGLFGVLASIAAYRDGRPWLDEVRAQLAVNAALVDEFVRARMPEVGYVLPEATYLAWLDFTRTPIADDPAAALLEHGRVALNAGQMFGSNGIGFARLNFATSPAILDEVLERIAMQVNPE